MRRTRNYLHGSKGRNTNFDARPRCDNRKFLETVANRECNGRVIPAALFPQLEGALTVGS